MAMISDGPIVSADGFDAAHAGVAAPLASFGGLLPSVEMAGPEKAAILMITLGLELSATIFKFLRQDEVERIVLEIAKISTVSVEKRDAVVQEAYQRAIALKYINEGGIEYAKEILERSFGAGQADDMTNRLFAALKHGNPLELVKKTEPAQLLEFIKEEHPQTIALSARAGSASRGRDAHRDLAEDRTRDLGAAR
jgi:flagellar motor switch protein FliG